MNPFYKDPLGRLMNYDEMKPNALYGQPYYSGDEGHKVDEEARKYIFRTNNDLSKVRRCLQKYGRSLVQVSTVLKYLIGIQVIDLNKLKLY